MSLLPVFKDYCDLFCPLLPKSKLEKVVGAVLEYSLAKFCQSSPQLSMQYILVYPDIDIGYRSDFSQKTNIKFNWTLCKIANINTPINSPFCSWAADLCK